MQITWEACNTIKIRGENYFDVFILLNFAQLGKEKVYICKIQFIVHTLTPLWPGWHFPFSRYIKNTYCAAHPGALLIFSTGPSDKTPYELVIKTRADKYNSCSDLVRNLNHFHPWSLLIAHMRYLKVIEHCYFNKGLFVLEPLNHRHPIKLLRVLRAQSDGLQIGISAAVWTKVILQMINTWPCISMTIMKTRVPEGLQMQLRRKPHKLCTKHYFTSTIETFSSRK